MHSRCRWRSSAATLEDHAAMGPAELRESTICIEAVDHRRIFRRNLCHVYSEEGPAENRRIRFVASIPRPADAMHRRVVAVWLAEDMIRISRRLARARPARSPRRPGGMSARPAGGGISRNGTGLPTRSGWWSGDRFGHGPFDLRGYRIAASSSSDSVGELAASVPILKF